jgi:hypothetical protein
MDLIKSTALNTLPSPHVMTEISKVYKGVPFTDSLENYLGKEHVSLCQLKPGISSMM